MTNELKPRVEELERRVDELEERIKSGVVPTTGSDLDSFLQDVSPATHVERATAIGFYLTHKAGQDSFDVGDIDGGYVDARVPKPANLSDVLAGAEDKGWLMHSETRGQTQHWKITRQGDEAVKSEFEQ